MRVIKIQIDGCNGPTVASGTTLVLELPLVDNALSLDDLRAAFAELVGRADLDITGEQMRQAFEDAIHPYPTLAEEQDAVSSNEEKTDNG